MHAQNNSKKILKDHKKLNASDKKNVTAKIYSKGTMRIPTAVRNDMQLKDGNEIQFIKHGTDWLITTREKMFQDAQSYFTSLNPNNKSLVDELITERHQLAKEGK